MKTKIHYSNIDTYRNNAYIGSELMHIDKNMDLFDKLTKTDIIPFNEYIDTINILYNVEITDNDLIRMSSFILGATPKIVILNTDILCETTKRIQVNNQFKYFDEIHKLYIKVAFTDELTNFIHEYSYDEVLELINKNKIVLLDLLLNNEGDYYEEIFEYKELHSLKMITGNDFINLKYVRKDYIPAIYSFLKQYFSTSKLTNDFDSYIDDVKIKLTSLDQYISNLKNGYSSRNLELDEILLESKRIRQRKASKDY